MRPLRGLEERHNEAMTPLLLLSPDPGNNVSSPLLFSWSWEAVGRAGIPQVGGGYPRSTLPSTHLHRTPGTPPSSLLPLYWCPVRAVALGGI